MKLRILISAVLVTALALPVIATATRFPDVPDDHQHADAIRWASDPEEFNGSPIFKGFPDGNFGPDEELTESQFAKVVDRLFDTADRWTRAETAALLYHGFQGLRTTTTTTTTQPVTETTTTTTITTTTTLSYSSRYQIPAQYQQWLDDWQAESERIDNLLESIEQNLRASGWWKIEQAINDIRRSRERARSMSDLAYNWAWEVGDPLPWNMDFWDKWRVALAKVSRQQIKAQDLQSEYSRQIPIPVVSIDTAPEFYSEGNGITSFDIIFSTETNENLGMIICNTARRINLIGGVDNRVRVHCPSEPEQSTELLVFTDSYSGGRKKGLIIIYQSLSPGSCRPFPCDFFPIPTGTNTQINEQQLKPQIRIIEDQNPNNVVVEVIVGNSDLARRTTATGSTHTDNRRPNVRWPADSHRYDYIHKMVYRGENYLWFENMEFDDDRFRLVIKGTSLQEIDGDFSGTIHLNEPGAPTHHLTYNSQMVVQSDSTTGSETS